MKRSQNIKIIVAFVLFGIAILLTSLAVNSYQVYLKSRASGGTGTDFDQYCRDGVYYVKSPKDGTEISCGRAPNCGGTSYDDTANIKWRDGNADCWIEDYWGGDRCKAYCAGYVPLCCYKMAESGNAEDCPFPERGYCMRDQCKAQTADSSCGAQLGTYCIDVDHCVDAKSEIPKFSLADRLAGLSTPSGDTTSTPTPTNTSVPTDNPDNPTNSPTPSSTPDPSQTAVPTQSPTPLATGTPTARPTATPTATHTPTPTVTSTPTPTHTPTPTVTPIPTSTPTPEPTFTPIPTNTPRPTLTPQLTYTPYPTLIAQSSTISTPVTKLVVNDQPPGSTPWALVLIPIGLIFIGLLL